MANINSDNEINNYYKILGVDSTSDTQTIKNAYKKLAMKYHPDKNPNDLEKAEQKFKKINEAYGVLSNKEKKDKYDRYGKAGLDGNNVMNNDAPGEAFEIFNTFFDRKFGENNYMGHNIFVNTTYTNRYGDPTVEPMINRPNIIKNGVKVVTINLKNMPEQNNKHGKIEGYNKCKNRYIVRLQNYKIISLKIENILQCLYVKIVNLKNNTEFNKTIGKIVGYNEKINRYNVSVCENILSLKNENIIIENGSCIVIRNIKDKPYLNGQRGTIQDYIIISERYKILLPSGKSYNIQIKNVNI